MKQVSKNVNAITIRGINDDIKKRLRIHAAMFNRTMEAQAREILISALSEEIRSGNDLVRAIRQDICELNLEGIELEITPREQSRELPNF